MKNLVELHGKQYEKNVTAFKVRNRWAPLDKLEIDNVTKEYDFKTSLLPYQDFDDKTKYTSHLVRVNLPSKKIEICFKEIEKELASFVYHNDEYYFLGEDYRLSPRSKYSPPTKIYSVSDSKEVIAKVESIDNNLSFLKDYTFGVELETSGIPLKSVAAHHGFYELYDGSISGPEYASRVLKYDNFHTIERFLLILKTMSSFNANCSLHIHIGNIEYSSDNLCAIYSLFQRLQEDLNLLIAPYKKDYNFLYGKQKDHCKNLPLIPNIDESTIMSLFKLNCNEDYSDDHPINSTSKWNIEGRYYTVNFVNYICKDHPNNTIEIRSLQMTFDYNYFLTWLIINVSIIDYALKNTEKILNRKEKIQVEDCLQGLPEDILEKVLFNYRAIKNKIYSLKYINGNLTTSILVDQHIKLQDICSSKININKDFLLKLYNIKGKSIAKDPFENHFKIPILIVNDHPGGWTYPSRSDCQVLLEQISRALSTTFDRNSLSYDARYYIDGNNIFTRNRGPIYNSSVIIDHYVIVEHNTISYTALFLDKNIVVELPFEAEHGYREDLEEI